MSDPGSQAPRPFSKLGVPPTCSASCAAWERPAGLHGSCQDKLCGSQPPSQPARARALPPPSRRPATTPMGHGPGSAEWREGTGGYCRVLGKEGLELEGRGPAGFLDLRVMLWLTTITKQQGGILGNGELNPSFLKAPKWSFSTWVPSLRPASP